jgi:hypothetical protein
VSRVNEGEGRGALPIELPITWTADRTIIIDDENIHDMQVPPFQHASERGIALKYVRVCVDWMKSGERLPDGLLGRSYGPAETAAGYTSGAYDGPQQFVQSIGHRVRSLYSRRDCRQAAFGSRHVLCGDCAMDRCVDLSAGRVVYVHFSTVGLMSAQQAKRKLTYGYCRLISFAIAWIGCQGESLPTLLRYNAWPWDL